MKKHEIKGVFDVYEKILNKLEDLEIQCNTIRMEVRDMNSALSMALGVKPIAPEDIIKLNKMIRLKKDMNRISELREQELKNEKRKKT